MDIKLLTKEQIEMLRERLPDEAVSQHPTKTYLSSIKAIYVIERLNKVFGIGNWTYTVDIVDNKTDMIVVKVKLSIPEYNINFESFGGNDNGGENSKNFDLGDAYKGATTDAITKIASYLEIGIDVFKGLHKGKSSNSYQKPQETKPSESSGVSKPKTMEQLCKVLTYEQYNTLNGNQKLKIQSYISETQKLGTPFASDEEVKAFLTK